MTTTDFSITLDAPRPMSKLTSKPIPLPGDLEYYTPHHLARALAMAVSTVRYHLAHLFRQWEGHWRLSHDQAMRALRYIEQARYDARRATLN